MEEWRDVVGYEGYYQVSSLGRVYGVPRKGKPGGGLIAISCRKADGYLIASLCTPLLGVKKKSVHVLVAQAFLGPAPEGHEVSHEDGDRSNAALRNLRYRTHLANVALSEGHGNKRLGEDTTRAVLTNEDVLRIKTAGAVVGCRKFGYAAIGSKYGVTKATIRAIFTGRTWSQIVVQ